MQHKATNFESIYFLEERNFLKVTENYNSFNFFVLCVPEFYETFNCVLVKNLLIFFIAYLKRKKKATYYLTFL